MLDYVFISEHHNGTVIRQNPDDVSIIRPQDKSAFYDVIHNESPVKRFSLMGKGHLFTIDLTDGHYEIDGRAVYTNRPPEQADLRLIYFRRVEHRIDTNNVQKPITRYYIGWQTTYKGKNYKFELGID